MIGAVNAWKNVLETSSSASGSLRLRSRKAGTRSRSESDGGKKSGNSKKSKDVGQLSINERQSSSRS